MNYTSKQCLNAISRIVFNYRVKLKLYVSNKAEPEPRIDVGSSACGEVGCSLAGLVIEIDEQKK